MLVTAFTIFSCSQEAVLSKEDAKFNLATLKDSIPTDSIDSTDTIPTDTIPTIDSTYYRIEGLNITPSSVNDTAVLLEIETTNTFPGENVLLETYSNNVDSGWSINVTRAYNVYPYNPGPSVAKRKIWHQPFTNGTRPFSITIVGATYHGQLTATSSGYTISWAHDNVVNISPKSFPR
jgi:hypothetical protein